MLRQDGRARPKEKAISIPSTIYPTEAHRTRLESTRGRFFLGFSFLRVTEPCSAVCHQTERTGASGATRRPPTWRIAVSHSLLAARACPLPPVRREKGTEKRQSQKSIEVSSKVASPQRKGLSRPSIVGKEQKGAPSLPRGLPRTRMTARVMASRRVSARRLSMRKRPRNHVHSVETP